MKRFIKLVLVVGFGAVLYGCPADSKHEISGTVGVEIDITEAEFTQINGINYFRTTQAGIVTACMALDPSTLYSNGWFSIPVQNAIRTDTGAPYTAEELANCPQ